MKTLAERSYALWRGSHANPHDAPHWLDLTSAERDSYIAVSRHILMLAASRARRIQLGDPSLPNLPADQVIMALDDGPS